MAVKYNVPSGNNDKKTKINYNEFPLAKANFIHMAIAGFLIVLGFILMAGGANEGDVFNNDIFSTRRIVIGPGLSFIGFVYMAFAIIFKKKENKDKEINE